MSKVKAYNPTLLLTNESHFNRFPILTNHGPLIENYLERMLWVIDNAISEYPRTLAIRVDLRLPQGYGDAGSDLMSRFTESLKAQIRADLHRKDMQGTRVHQCNLRYIWVKERSNSFSPHFHVLLLLNHDAYHTLGDFNAEHGRNMAARIRKAWASALGSELDAVIGLVEFPKNAVYRLNTYSNDFHQTRIDLFRRMSYFAKLNTKEFGSKSRNFGCSLR